MEVIIKRALPAAVSWHVSFIADNLRLVFLCGSDGRRGDITSGAVTQYEPLISQLDQFLSSSPQVRKVLQFLFIDQQTLQLVNNLSIFQQVFAMKPASALLRGECDLTASVTPPAQPFQALIWSFSSMTNVRTSVPVDMVGGKSVRASSSGWINWKKSGSKKPDGEYELIIIPQEALQFQGTA